jgi:S-adenosylmethionine:tRNA ribosyltransferase-isomerase
LKETFPLESFNYKLPEELIAQSPEPHRSNSKLLCINKKTTKIDHTSFSSLPEQLNNNDVLVLNNTKVMRSRVFCYRTSGAKIECFFLKNLGDHQWEVLLKKSQRLKINEILHINTHNKIQLIKKHNKTAVVKIQSNLDDLSFINQFGEIPLPPYIKQKNSPTFEESYQTIFASEPGAVAAPTASLHFTHNIFAQLKQKKIEIIYITLHIGLGTFNPIESDNIYEHTMHEENYHISTLAAKQLNNALDKKKRIIAVGTTVTRCLESNIKNKRFSSGEKSTCLFITPTYEFKCIQAMITNFHLPKSSLFILIASFIGLENAHNAYNIAIKNKYRFFSFGDAMFIT